MTNIYDITSLGSDIVEISVAIENLINKSDAVNIDGIGYIDAKNKDIVINAMKLTYEIKSKLKAPKKCYRKLNENEELKLIDYAKKGHKRADMAKKFNISQATVNRILKRYGVKLPNGRPRKKN